MGISAKIWIITDAEIARALADNRYTNTLFHAAKDDYAKIWGARPLHATLQRLVDDNIGLQVIDKSDPTFAFGSTALRELLARDDADAIVHSLVEPELPSVGGDRGGDIVDLMVRAVNANAGIVFCIFEDW